LPQKCKTSRIELYSNAEPCSMCYTGIRWARINWIYFAATIYDAAAQGVRFSDEPIFNELSNNYADRADLGANVFQCEVDNSLDSFNHYKRTGAIKY
jgi:tRNA(Arg) A34 adenosine deaminase TadA